MQVVLKREESLVALVNESLPGLRRVSSLMYVCLLCENCAFAPSFGAGSGVIVACSGSRCCSKCVETVGFAPRACCHAETAIPIAASRKAHTAQNVKHPLLYTKEEHVDFPSAGRHESFGMLTIHPVFYFAAIAVNYNSRQLETFWKIPKRTLIREHVKTLQIRQLP